jgi:hypothetical protein
MTRFPSNLLRTLAATCCVAAPLASFAQAPNDGPPPTAGKAESLNMRLVGSDPLQGRTAYQPTIQKQGQRWIAYVGHHGDKKLNTLTGAMENNGTSVLDVTDPKKPKYLAHIPGEEGKAEQGGAQMVRVCAGADLPKADKSKFYMLRVFGNQAHEVWDVTTPEKPSLLTTIGRGLTGTHKNFWECDTGIAYLVSGNPQWRTNRMTQIYDLSDPAKPEFIRDFGLVGQQPGSGGAVPISLHGPISSGPKGNRVYFGYGTNTDGILQIVDREKLLKGPKEPTPENLLAPQVARLDLPPMHGAHTVFPLFGVDVPEFSKNLLGKKRDFIVVTDEAIQKECLEGRQMVWVVDVSTETKPFGVSSWTGARGQRQLLHPRRALRHPLVEREHGAGVPQEADVLRPLQRRRAGAGRAQPDEPEGSGLVHPGHDQGNRGAGNPGQHGASGLPFTEASKRKAIQTNNVEVDERGYVYIVDRANTGLHILELTGPARNIADWSAAVKN